jgi:hypothetical protein
VGPAVPLSQSVYVLPSFSLTLVASPETTSVVGPLYALILSCVHPAYDISADRDDRRLRLGFHPWQIENRTVWKQNIPKAMRDSRV